ncbi:ISEf1, transposase [Pediococcus cellicola]|uniref:Mutator family transposase n=1 Tax=Pediococcus cellicola TaxID=319652 RepID=A0A0R2ITA6_9LACO|nr:ISEf1, transposase [Pediococcus cellicola]GEL15459.1 hypothetical protein PCE01_12610 [Pediococcus cellicola]
MRTFNTKYGELNLTIPRDRNREFVNHTLPAYQRRTDQLEQNVIQLYEKGITTHEIAGLMEKMYGSYYMPQTVSTLTKVVKEQVEAFKNRTLSERYTVVYLDATFLPYGVTRLPKKQFILRLAFNLMVIRKCYLTR